MPNADQFKTIAEAYLSDLGLVNCEELYTGCMAVYVQNKEAIYYAPFLIDLMEQLTPNEIGEYLKVKFTREISSCAK